MNKKLDQHGAVAIITVVIFATIISVLITAYLRSAVSSQRESIDYDFSNRAFYAAESGVQDTIRLIRSDITANLVDKTGCTPKIGSNPDFNATNFGLSYNCQLVTVSPATLSGRVEPNKKSAMIRLEPSVPITGTDSPKIVMRWSSQVPAGSSEPVLYPRGDNKKLFKPVTNWFVDAAGTQPIHPPLEVSVYDHPSAVNFIRSDIKQRRVFLNPTPNDDDGDVDFKKPGSLPIQQEQLFNNAECYESNDVTQPSYMNSYSCKQTIDIAGYDFTNSAVYVRVSSIYASTNFTLELLKGVTPVQLKNSQALIDITGKAGSNTYRRVQQAVPLSNFQIQYGPNAALVVGQGICKQLVLGVNTSVYANNPGSCDPLN